MFNKIITAKEENFNSLEKKIYKNVCDLGCFIIKTYLEEYDKKLMEGRDKKKYRCKGKRRTSVTTVMGPVEYSRNLYEIKENAAVKRVFLLDEMLNIKSHGKQSSNYIEKILEIAAKSVSYREAENTMEKLTNSPVSFETIRKTVLKVGDEITSREQEEIKLHKKGQLIPGKKKVLALFEEADGIWINLQGKDRKLQELLYKRRCEREGKKYVKRKVKTELKLHVMYEGWKKDDIRHPLVNKQYIAGIMKPKEISELRDARVHQEYDEKGIRLRATNGDGAQWTKGTTAKGGVYQKDEFHIMQEIVRDVPKEYQNRIKNLVKNKEYSKIQGEIEKLKYEVGGEENAVNKLRKLQSYLSSGLERYQELVEVPEAPEGVEYRNMGTQESQIFSMLKKRFCSGRKAFSKRGANALAKICVLSEKFRLDDLEKPIPVDTSVEDWIKAIEKNVKKNKTRHCANKAVPNSQNAVHHSHSEYKFMDEIGKIKPISELQLIYNF